MPRNPCRADPQAEITSLREPCLPRALLLTSVFRESDLAALNPVPHEAVRSLIVLLQGTSYIPIIFDACEIVR